MGARGTGLKMSVCVCVGEGIVRNVPGQCGTRRLRYICAHNDVCGVGGGGCGGR